MSSEAASKALSSYWQQKIDTWRKSEQSQQAFCRAHDLSYARFIYWRRKFATSATKRRSSSSSALVPVRYRTPSVVSGLELVLPSGIELRGLSEDNLSVAVELLARLS